MKKTYNIDQAKTYVENLVGKDVNVRLNKGRNRIKHYKGIVSEAHPNVFVINLYDDLFDRISCSYTDVVCGEIVLNAYSEQ